MIFNDSAFHKLGMASLRNEYNNMIMETRCFIIDNCLVSLNNRGSQLSVVPISLLRKYGSQYERVAVLRFGSKVRENNAVQSIINDNRFYEMIFN